MNHVANRRRMQNIARREIELDLIEAYTALFAAKEARAATYPDTHERAMAVSDVSRARTELAEAYEQAERALGCSSARRLDDRAEKTAANLFAASC